MVAGWQREIRDTDLQPQRAAELLAKLTAVLGNCTAEMREADMAYNLRLLACLASETKANRARIVAETSEEYQRKREARDTRDLVEAMIGSLKYVLRAAEAEMRSAR